ncbi:alpha/beta hydrolase-fold protein [Mucilaginibacter kameinonensis]|uniref:alpha/beta hydrolase-fold protein n=1 Tax=Mucilaginibacter kameinonensis TaxID=452286 RepID=UPI000EF7E330|nr:alpha/beta hydrolase-fold protein [Mucilaginibacter kameinonensis]
MSHYLCKSLFLLCFFVNQVCAQSISDGNITIGKEERLHSKILNEDQTYWVSLPLNYDNPKFASAKFPVIYVLDGDANFATVSAMIRQLSVRNGNSILPEAIVIGVMNNHRSRDFTPYSSSFWLYDTPPPFNHSGGGENFTTYLSEELIPHIDSAYHTAPYRVLIGHSLGGLAATNVLVHHQSMFNGYIIIDPSLWFDNQIFLKKSLDVLRKGQFSGISLYLGIANNLSPGMDTLQMMKDTARKNLHMRSIFRFKNTLLNIHGNGLRFKYLYYRNDTHMSIPMIAEYDGLRFLFDFYRLPGSVEQTFFDPQNHDDPGQVISRHFEKVSRVLGYRVLPPESLVNLFANTMQNYYLPDKALRLYLLNTQDYPQSYGAWESLGDYYVQQKRYQEAIQSYQHALKLNAPKKVEDKISALEKVN